MVALALRMADTVLAFADYEPFTMRMMTVFEHTRAWKEWLDTQSIAYRITRLLREEDGETWMNVYLVVDDEADAMHFLLMAGVEARRIMASADEMVDLRKCAAVSPKT